MNSIRYELMNADKGYMCVTIPFLQIFWRSKFFLYKKLRRYLWICSYLKIKSLVPKKKVERKEEEDDRNLSPVLEPQDSQAGRAAQTLIWPHPTAGHMVFLAALPCLLSCPRPQVTGCCKVFLSGSVSVRFQNLRMMQSGLGSTPPQIWGTWRQGCRGFPLWSWACVLWGLWARWMVYSMFFKLLILCQVMHKKVSTALPSSKWQGRVSNLGISEPRSMTQPPCYIASAWNLGSPSHSELREPSGRLAANLQGGNESNSETKQYPTNKTWLRGPLRGSGTQTEGGCWVLEQGGIRVSS